MNTTDRTQKPVGSGQETDPMFWDITITLCTQLQHSLAEMFAKTIIAAVTTQHLALLGGSPHLHGLPHERGTSFREVQQAIHSVRGEARPYFIKWIKWHFLQLRNSYQIEIRGRDYVAKVRAYEATQTGGRAA